MKKLITIFLISIIMLSGNTLVNAEEEPELHISLSFDKKQYHNYYYVVGEEIGLTIHYAVYNLKTYSGSEATIHAEVKVLEDNDDRKEVYSFDTVQILNKETNNYQIKTYYLNEIFNEGDYVIEVKSSLDENFQDSLLNNINFSVIPISVHDVNYYKVVEYEEEVEFDLKSDIKRDVTVTIFDTETGQSVSNSTYLNLIEGSQSLVMDISILGTGNFTISVTFESTLTYEEAIIESYIIVVNDIDNITEYSGLTADRETNFYLSMVLSALILTPLLIKKLKR